MGIHPLDLLIILLVVLALFGAKTLQSISHSAGKTVGQAKVMKDKLMAELPVEEISQIKEGIPQVPLNSRQAAQMLVNSALTPAKGEEKSREQEPQQTSKADKSQA
jgi:Sec-independent protein translocase protein TatA